MSKPRPAAIAAAAITATASVVLTPATPAHAATAAFPDAAGDVAVGVDLRSVEVVNNDRLVRVVSTHRDLVRRPSSAAGGTVFLDTDPDDAGPEHALVGGYFEGTDYVLLRVEGWNTRKAATPVRCGYVSRIDYDAETVRSRFDRDCFGDADVRVEVKVAGAKPGGGTAVDWLGAPTSFGPVVAQG